MPASSIGKGAIKISFIQTIPGYEGLVESELQSACKKIATIDDYVFFKGLGSFDIILVYATKDFGSNLREAGPIKHILKSNLLLCYPYLSRDIKDIFSLLKKQLFTAFCLLKIDPGLKLRYPKIDLHFREFINHPDASLLGSLGWNELIILLSGNAIDNICQYISNNTSTYFKTKQENLPAILKTMSFVGINYDKIPSSNILKNFDKTKDIFDNITELNKPICATTPFSTNLSINISAKSIYFKEIETYFKSKGFEFSKLLGKHDILVKLNKKSGITWSHFLATILHFRSSKQNKIFSTNTRISFQEREDDRKPLKVKDLSTEVKPLKFNYKVLKNILGKNMTSHLSNLFYTLNSLLQNPLTGSIYADMRKYPDYVLRTVKEAKKYNPMALDQLAFVSGNALGRGIEVRSYGTYETIEEVTGRFAEFRGGCQVSLIAMELLPYTIMKKLNALVNPSNKESEDLSWHGFITVTGEPKFSHINDVINVVTEALWSPQYWWAIYHEIAHIIFEKLRPIVENRISFAKYMANRDDNAIDELIEFCAEAIGYELGFFGDYDLYLSRLWTYLANLEKLEQIPLAAYAIRTFFVELYSKHFRSSVKKVNIKEEFFDDLDLLYARFIEHMDKIETDIVKRPLFEKKSFIAAYNVTKFRDLYSFYEDLSEDVKYLNLRPDKLHLKSKNTTAVIRSLIKGRIWWDQIDCPEAILFHLFNLKKIEFNTQMATISSFWNQHARNIYQK